MGVGVTECAPCIDFASPNAPINGLAPALLEVFRASSAKPPGIGGTGGIHVSKSGDPVVLDDEGCSNDAR